MSRGNTHTFDGLVKGYGTHSVDNEIASVFQGSNGVVTVTQEIDVLSLVALASVDEDSYPNASKQGHVIPRGSVFLTGFVEVLVVCTGSSSDMDIGTWSNGLGTEVTDDPNGLKDAIEVATVAELGDVISLDGDLMTLHQDDADLAVAGAVSNSDVVIVYGFQTAYTAGRLKVVVNYMPPTGSSGRTIAA